MISTDDIQIDLSFWNKEDEKKLSTLKLVLNGYNNNCIATELNFSIKNIESIISKLLRRVDILTKGENASLINPRAKLLSNGICKDWVRFRVADDLEGRELLARSQYLTLILCTGGCSNKAIADFLCISPKTVESRLNTLFNIFRINTHHNKNLINPRIKLIATALQQRVITTYAIKVASEILNLDTWADVIKNREQIKETFFKLQFDSMRPYILQPETNLSSVSQRLPLLQKNLSQMVPLYNSYPANQAPFNNQFK